MRHSTPVLTANVYTDPKLLDVHGALDTLPLLRLDGANREQQRLTGTLGLADSLAPTLALTEFNPSTLTKRDKLPRNEAGRLLDATGQNVKGRTLPTTLDCPIPSRGDRIRTCDFMVPNRSGRSSKTAELFAIATTSGFYEFNRMKSNHRF